MLCTSAPINGDHLMTVTTTARPDPMEAATAAIRTLQRAEIRLAHVRAHTLHVQIQANTAADIGGFPDEYPKRLVVEAADALRAASEAYANAEVEAVAACAVLTGEQPVAHPEQIRRATGEHLAALASLHTVSAMAERAAKADTKAVAERWLDTIGAEAQSVLVKQVRSADLAAAIVEASTARIASVAAYCEGD
jgi:hypothetical protein